MQRHFFLQLENQATETRLSLNEVLAQLPFDDKGLLPVIPQDANTKKY